LRRLGAFDEGAARDERAPGAADALAVNAVFRPNLAMILAASRVFRRPMIQGEAYAP